MTLCEHHKCTGCGVCQAVCHKDAISFTIDELGFRYPVIDKTRCIECGSCIKICPSLNPIVVEGYDDCYLAWAKDDTIHYESASGGISTVLNKHFINGGGFAIGCSWDAEFNAVLAIIESDTELKRTRGSKYVMSYIANTVWGDIKKRTQKGQKGLVIGLPCQVAAIKSFTKDDENILFVDLICKGGCSPACLKTHLSYLKKRKRLPNITDIRFRGGDNDCYFSLWNNDKIVYKKNISQDPYFYSFMKHGLFRESCYQCQYATSERVSDITIADFWGIDSEFVKDKNTLNGTNLVIVHSDKGRKEGQGAVPAAGTDASHYSLQSADCRRTRQDLRCEQ